MFLYYFLGKYKFFFQFLVVLTQQVTVILVLEAINVQKFVFYCDLNVIYLWSRSFGNGKANIFGESLELI